MNSDNIDYINEIPDERKRYYDTRMMRIDNSATPPLHRITKRRSVEKAILRFVRRGVLNFQESKAAFAFLTMVENSHGQAIKTHSLASNGTGSHHQKWTGDSLLAARLSSKHRYEKWMCEMQAQGLEVMVVLDFILNGIPFSRLDKRARKQNGWARQQFISGMKIFETVCTR